MIFLHELLCVYFFRPVFLLYTHIYVWFAWCARSVFDVTICHNQWNCWFHTFYIFFFSSSLIRMLLLKCALFPLFKPPTKESCEHFLSFMRISQPLSLFCFVWLRFRQRNTIFFPPYAHTYHVTEIRLFFSSNYQQQTINYLFKLLRFENCNALNGNSLNENVHGFK